VGDQASFAVRLIDRVTRPARAIAAALERIEKPLKRLKRSAAFKVIDRAASSTLQWAKSAAIGITAAGAAIGAVTVGMTVNMARFAESSRLAFRYLYGGAAAGGKAFDTSIRLARELGQDVTEVTGQFIKLRAAQFDLGQSEQVFLLAADLKALTGDAEAAKRAVTAITQIKAKGRLQAEELVGQLAEAGVSTVLVYEALGRRLNKTTDQVRKLITAGAIGSDVAIEAIKEAVTHKIGEKNLGDFARQQAKVTLGGAFDRLLAAPKLFFLRVAEEAKPAMQSVKASVESAIAAIGGLDVRAFADFVSRVVSLLPVAIDLVRQFASGFGEGFSEVLGGISGLNSLATDQRKLWFDFGKNVAKGFALIFSLLEKIGELVAFLLTPAGKVVAAIGGLVLFLPKIIAVVGTIVTISEAIVAGIGAVLPIIGTVLGAIVAYGSVFVDIGIAVVGAVAGIIAAVGAVPLAIIAATIAAAAAIIYWGDEIGAFFVGAGKWLWDAGGSLISGLVDGFLAGWRALKSSIAGVADSIVDTVKGVLGIASPSRVMAALGQDTVAGYVEGIQSERRSATSSGVELAGDGAAAFERGSGEASSGGRVRRIVQSVTIQRLNITVGGTNASPRDIRNAAAAGLRDALHQSGEYAGA